MRTFFIPPGSTVHYAPKRDWNWSKKGLSPTKPYILLRWGEKDSSCALLTRDFFHPLGGIPSERTYIYIWVPAQHITRIYGEL